MAELGLLTRVIKELKLANKNLQAIVESLDQIGKLVSNINTIAEEKRT